MTVDLLVIDEAPNHRFARIIEAEMGEEARRKDQLVVSESHHAKEYE